MPCFLKCRSASLASCWSAIARNSGSASSTITSAAEAPPHAAELQADDPGPDHRQALGHDSNSSAPQESTISGDLKGAERSSIGAEPEAQHHAASR